MSKILIEDYLKRGQSRPSLPFLNEYSNLSSNIISTLSIRNDIENTGKECVLMKSGSIDLII